MRAPVPPWADLPPSLGDLLRPQLAPVVGAVIAALPLEVPDYARPLEGRFGEGVRVGVQVALGRFLDLPGTTEPALAGTDREVYVALGRGELRQGRQLATLLAAYRVGARVAFRRFAGVVGGGPSGVDPDVLIRLAEAVFAYIDELSAASVDGYAQEQSLRAGESGRRRSQLLDLLLAGRLDATEAVAMARQAGWPLPGTVVVVVLPVAAADGLAVALGESALVGERDGQVVVVVAAPGPAADRARLERRLAGRSAAVGPTVPWEAAAVSLRIAGLAAALPGTEAAGVRWAEDHLAALLVRGGGVPELATALGARRLAPLETLKEGPRERMAETLLAWLRHRGERQHVAAELHVHTQTVGYRLGQLRALFGDALDDPDARFELELALRARPC